MPRPVMLGIVGDSGSGKTTITRGLVRVLGEDQVTHFCTDDYHRYDRRQRAERNITPLDPDCNHLDILAQHLDAPARERADHEARLPAHATAPSARPTTSCPAASSSPRGCSASTTDELADSFDVRVYLDPPEELRRHWKVQRDCSRRGYTTDQVLSELDRREPDSERYIRPQRHRADIVVSFQPGLDEDQEHLDCKLTLCDSLDHPDLTGVVSGDEDGDRAHRACRARRSSTSPAGSRTSAPPRSKR